jgi:hypothetical protein
VSSPAVPWQRLLAVESQLYIHGCLGLEYHLLQKVNATADCFENQFTPYELCDNSHEWRVEAEVQAKLKKTDNNRAPMTHKK